MATETEMKSDYYKEIQDVSRKAFDQAIKEGRLSTDPLAKNYAGSYMYMDHYEGKDHFKNILSRDYDV